MVKTSRFVADERLEHTAVESTNFAVYPEFTQFRQEQRGFGRDPLLLIETHFKGLNEFRKASTRYLVIACIWR